MKLKYVFSSLGILICLSVFADGVKPAKVGEQSPDFQFADKNGKMYSLKDFKGQYVFIDIWATHCFPCKEEIPYLEEIQEKLKKKNIAFIGIATLDKEGKIINLNMPRPSNPQCMKILKSLKR